MFCPECGKTVENDAAYCPECGVRIKNTRGVMPAPSFFGRTDKRYLPSLIGGALLLISFFMPWIDFMIMSVPGFKLIKVASGMDTLLAIIAWLVPIGGAMTTYLSYRKNENVKKAALVTGLVALLVWVWLLSSIGADLKRMGASFGDIFKAMDIGLYFMMVGVVFLGISLRSWDIIRSTAPQSKVISKSIFCTQCGKENLTSACFCINCGQRLE
jgi:drug/metabolite transporter superfamily protein YnfA